MNVCYYYKPVARKVLEQAAVLAAILASMGSPAWPHHHANDGKQVLRAACSLLQSAAKSDEGPLELRDKWTSNTEARLPTKAMQVHLIYPSWRTLLHRAGHRLFLCPTGNCIHLCCGIRMCETLAELTLCSCCSRAADAHK